MASMITNLPPAPLLTDARGAFDAKTAAFTQALPAFGAEANALAGEVWALYAAFLSALFPLFLFLCFFCAFISLRPLVWLW